MAKQGITKVVKDDGDPAKQIALAASMVALRGRVERMAMALAKQGNGRFTRKSITDQIGSDRRIEADRIIDQLIEDGQLREVDGVLRLTGA